MRASRLARLGEQGREHVARVVLPRLVAGGAHLAGDRQDARREHRGGVGQRLDALRRDRRDERGPRLDERDVRRDAAVLLADARVRDERGALVGVRLRAVRAHRRGVGRDTGHARAVRVEDEGPCRGALPARLPDGERCRTGVGLAEVQIHRAVVLDEDRRNGVVRGGGGGGGGGLVRHGR
jgi:hypothetical protein